MGFRCPECHKDFGFRHDLLKGHMGYCCSNKKPSKALSILKSRLKEELNIDVDIGTFHRTYAGGNQKSQGAFVWVIHTQSGDEIGCCCNLSNIFMKNTKLEIGDGWGDYELFITPK